MEASSRKTRRIEKREERKLKNLPKHIAVMRLSALGDVAMLSHTLRAFKEEYPSVKITVVTRALCRPFFEGLDVEIFEVDTNGRHKGLKGEWRLLCDLIGLGIDAFADAHGVLRSMQLRWLMRFAGRRVERIRKGRVEKWFRVGYNSHNGVPLKHSVVRYCDVLRRMGFEFENPEAVSREEALQRPNPMGEKSGKWVGVAPFSAHKGKTYPEPMAEELVGLLAGEYERVFIHGGCGSEAEFAQRMEAKYKNVTALFGKVKLGDELNLIAHLDCIVSMDSVAMHMASLTATPVASIWGATHPALGFLGWGCDERGVLQEEMKCRPCSVYGERKCRTGSYKCLKVITPQMVVDKVKELVG